MPAETDQQKQEMLRKRRRETRADALLRLPMEEMRTRQSSDCITCAISTLRDLRAQFRYLHANFQHFLYG